MASNERTPVTTETPPLLLGTRAVAAMLGVSDWRVRELVAEGTLAPVRFGENGKFRFRRADIIRLVQGEATSP